MKEYFVYITTNHTGSVLYTGMTSTLEFRSSQHRLRLTESFTKRYKADKLVYYEATTDVQAAIAREKEIKGWSRRKKIALIEATNPRWRHLAAPEPIALEGRFRPTPTDSFAEPHDSAHQYGRRSE